jgi:hypothetical protein
MERSSLLRAMAILITHMSAQLRPGISGSAEEHMPHTLLSKL